ncbi:MAG: hypothetical protein KC475_09780 [Cyanobacteria bacterium HKST-UBA03]|nr:hypothetical protein [Cyanobacteria bacterium HKST-UBA03]
MKSKHCYISVSSSMTLNRPLYFIYKGTQFKFCPSEDKKYSDSLICRMGELNHPEVYRKVCELFASISYAHKVKAHVGGGITNEVAMDIPLSEFKGGAYERRSVAITESYETFYSLALVRNDHQSNLVRLYRKARLADDAYFSSLFYWHALVYPYKKEQKAVKFINDNLGKVREDDVKRLTDEALFLKSGKVLDVGEYIRKGLRHSIAHIKRENEDYSDLNLDDYDEIRHINTARSILEELVRIRAEKDFGLEVGNDLNIFSPFDP